VTVTFFAHQAFTDQRTIACFNLMNAVDFFAGVDKLIKQGIYECAYPLHEVNLILFFVYY